MLRHRMGAAASRARAKARFGFAATHQMISSNISSNTKQKASNNFSCRRFAIWFAHVRLGRRPFTSPWRMQMHRTLKWTYLMLFEPC